MDQYVAVSVQSGHKVAGQNIRNDFRCWFVSTTDISIENGRFYGCFTFENVDVHRYVSLPEGKSTAESSFQSLDGHVGIYCTPFLDASIRRFGGYNYPIHVQ